MHVSSDKYTDRDKYQSTRFLFQIVNINGIYIFQHLLASEAVHVLLITKEIVTLSVVCGQVLPSQLSILSGLSGLW